MTLNKLPERSFVLSFSLNSYHREETEYTLTVEISSWQGANVELSSFIEFRSELKDIFICCLFIKLFKN